MMTKLLISLEFDIHPRCSGTVELRESGACDEVVLCCEGQEFPILQSDRDQWGVWYTVNGAVIAQEDGTRSFLDALIQCLTEVKRRAECETKPATAVV
jgi:hypothetical protein